jgi:Cu2+-exporting ATPase
MPVLLRAAAAIQQRRLEGAVLEASALLLMVGRGNYAASALLGWLRSLGEFIVAKSVVTTRRSLRELVAEPEQTVARVEHGHRRRVRIGAVVGGDVVTVEAGERLAVDGTVVNGEALVNQQSVTGEALPVERRPGDPVFAATTLEAGRIDVRVARVGLDTAVGRIVEAVEAAAREKSDIQTFAERLADRDVGRTLALAGLGAAFSRSLDAGTAIMVADYGLAARVGIPTAILASLNAASGSGILVKGPTALENLARVDTVVFDKTGTLTSGTPRVARMVSYQADLEQRQLARLVAAAEHGFGHPVARAVARYAAELGIDMPPATAAAETVGLGVDVRVDGRHVLVGSRRFMDARGIALDRARTDEAAAHAVGAAPAFVAVEGRLAGMLVLQDELRPDAPAAVAALRARRMRNVIMLSGDHPEPSRVIAESLGLRHYYADLLPEDKARLIRELKAEGRVVAMVGDGINDALALREADVGLAVPGGAAVATEAADVVLLRGGLERVVRALDLSAEAIARVRRTLRVASQANMVVVGLASFGLARPVTSILLSHGTTVAAALISAVQAGSAPVETASASAAPPPGR